MKFVILIHSNPQPWGHPTIAYTEPGRAVAAEQRAEMDSEFDVLLRELSSAGQLVSAEALADPATATIHRWTGTGATGEHVVTDGPYAEAKEHLAGFFLIDVESRERAEEIAAKFAGPGDTIELRPAMWDGAED